MINSVPTNFIPQKYQLEVLEKMDTCNEIKILGLSGASRQHSQEIIDSINNMQIGNLFELEDELDQRRWGDFQEEFELDCIYRARDMNGR